MKLCLRDIDSNVRHSDMILKVSGGFLCDVVVRPTLDTSWPPVVFGAEVFWSSSSSGSREAPVPLLPVGPPDVPASVSSQPAVNNLAEFHPAMAGGTTTTAHLFPLPSRSGTETAATASGVMPSMASSATTLATSNTSLPYNLFDMIGHRGGGGLSIPGMPVTTPISLPGMPPITVSATLPLTALQGLQVGSPAPQQQQQQQQQFYQPTTALANALVVLSSTAEDGEIEVQISVGFWSEKLRFESQAVTLRGFSTQCTSICVKEVWKTILEPRTPSTPDIYSNLDFPVIDSLIYCKSSVLDHAATKRVNLPSLHYIFQRDRQYWATYERLLTRQATLLLRVKPPIYLFVNQQSEMALRSFSHQISVNLVEDYGNSGRHLWKKQHAVTGEKFNFFRNSKLEVLSLDIA
uniref:Uncharacterized protein n=1 Tax=Timema genevievae TaxID=629358 RepID=A0A7R9JS52_TIMGE|nr:unnamed protein product [Timema genevievae]